MTVRRMAGWMAQAAAVAAGLAFFGACRIERSPTGPICPAVVQRAIEVAVTDQATGAPAAAGAVGTLRDGPYAETMQAVGFTNGVATTLGGATGRPGLYDVRVEKAGYQPWEAIGVRSESDACGVRTVPLTAALHTAP
jgi:hypothetical protein